MMSTFARGISGLLLGGLLAFSAPASQGNDLSSTIYRSLPASRTVADLDVQDFYDNMESGSLINLQKTGPGSFLFETQSDKVYGYQGTIRVWYYGMCDLRNVQIKEGERLKMNIRWPCGDQYVRPVYSYDAQHWNHVPEGWGRVNESYSFEIPLKAGESRVYFAAYYPYPSSRVLERAITQIQNPYVRELKTIGRTERERPILQLTITDPRTPDKGKFPVVINAGDHAGETASLWGMEGIVDFLLSEKPEAAALRKQAIFYIVPMLNMDGQSLGLDRRQATGVNIYFDYKKFESREARTMWKLVKTVRPVLWLDMHSWHLGKAEGIYGPHPKRIGEQAYAPVGKLLEIMGKRFPINHVGPDELDSPNTVALLELGIPGFCPEFNMGQGANGKWKTPEDDKALGAALMLGVSDYLKTLKPKSAAAPSRSPRRLAVRSRR